MGVTNSLGEEWTMFSSLHLWKCVCVCVCNSLLGGSSSSSVGKLVLNQILLPPLTSIAEQKSVVSDQIKHSAVIGAVSWVSLKTFKTFLSCERWGFLEPSRCSLLLMMPEAEVKTTTVMCPLCVCHLEVLHYPEIEKFLQHQPPKQSTRVNETRISFKLSINGPNIK